MARESGTSRRLGSEAVAYLGIAGTEIDVAATDTVIHKGDPGAAVFVVLDGEVEVQLRTRDGRHLALSRLGQGELFGELSVLRDSVATADVVAITDVRLLRYPAELFPAALAECDQLREQLLARLADSLHQTTADAWGLFKKEQAFADLARDEGLEDSMVAVSARMRSIKTRLAKLGQERSHVLVIGAPGTGRTMTARLVHRARGDDAEAMIVFDPQELPADSVHGALFGSYMVTDLLDSSGCFGAIHLAHGGSLILRNVDALAPDEQKHLAAYMRDLRSDHPPDFPNVRVIATAREIEGRDGRANLEPALAEELTEVVRLPSLKERPKDIVPLARHFLEELEGAEGRRLTRSAEHALVSLRCPVRNVDELRDVVELAARCSDGGEIRADHIFAGLGEEEAFGRALGTPPLVFGFVSGAGLRSLRAVTLVGFVAAIGLCLAPTGSLATQFANGFVWSVWEPVTFAVFLLVGALWCTVCPLSTAGRLMKRVWSLDRPPPVWLGHGAALAIPVIGFAAILWVEEFFHMTERPFGTGVLLLALIASSIVLCLIFEREVWCRHVCPLGKLATVLAPAAPLSLASNRSLCASTCTTHECYKGDGEVAGCTVFHHPLMTSEAHYCKLCADCLLSCPHGSTGLYLKPPLKGAWRLGGSGTYPSVFATTLVLIAPLFLAAQMTAALADPVILTVASLVAIVVGLVVGAALPGLLAIRQDPAAAAPRIAAAGAVLAWGPLMATQLGNIPLLSEVRLHVVPGAAVLLDRLADDLPILVLAQLAVILIAALAAAIILWRTRIHDVGEIRQTRPAAWPILFFMGLISTAVSAALVILLR